MKKQNKKTKADEKKFRREIREINDLLVLHREVSATMIFFGGRLPLDRN